MLNIPSFAQTYGAMQNRMKAQLEGKVPQGYHSDYEWGQFGKQIDAENREAAQQAEQDKERARQQPPPMSFNQMQQLQSNQLSQLRPDGFGQGGPLGFANGGLVPPMIKAANPEAYYDHRTGSTVIGDFSGSTKRARAFTWSGNAVKGGQVFQATGGKFGMPGPDERRAPIGGRATPPAPDMFGRQFGGADPFRTVYKGKFAEGGEVEGPGGPKDDMVPAMLSDGEFVMPAEAVKFFGVDKLHKMTQKAKEGLMEIPNGSAGTPARSGAKAADKNVRAPIPSFAEGGFVNPYADDAMAAAVREQQAKDARLAAIGGADFGGGRAGFTNRYGSGYAVPATDPLATTGPGVFNNGGDATRAVPGQGLVPMPDVIPAGPWSNGALPFDAQANQQSIDYALNTMRQTAPDARALDLAANASRLQYEPKGRAQITVPDANPFPNGTPGLNYFRSPSEKDADARAMREAPIQPFLDAGMKKSDIRSMMRTPQGVRALQDLQPRQPAITPESARAMGLEVASVDSSGNMQFSRRAAGGEDLPKRLKELDALMADKKQPLHIRELAKRERERAARETIQGGGEVKEKRGQITQIPGPMIEDPVTRKMIPGPTIPVLVDPVTGAYRHLTPQQAEGGGPAPQPGAGNPAPAPAAPSWSGWLDNKLKSGK